jgi:hypothetical protein
LNFVTPQLSNIWRGREHVATERHSLADEPEVITWWQVGLMFMLLGISGNPYLVGKPFDMLVVCFSVVSVVHMVRNYTKKVSYRTMFIFVFLLGYELMHAVMFGLDYSLTFFKLALLLLFGAVCVDILKEKFILVLTRTMVLISLVSFFFVFLSYTPVHRPLYNFAAKLFPVEEHMGYSTPTILIFTFCREYFSGELPYVRNAGIFWESGAFAVFLNVTLFLHYSTLTIRKVEDLFDWSSIILITALASTTSTMGALSLVIILSFFSSQLKTVLKYILLVLILGFSFLAFSTVDFLGEKVKRQLDESRVNNNRFGAAIKDFENISERPILGWSRRMEVVHGTTVKSEKTHRPNGLTNFLRSYGLVYFCTYFIFVFYSFKHVYKYYHHGSGRNNIPLFGIAILLISSFSELIFDLAFFKAIVFLFGAYFTATTVKPDPSHKLQL